jgi:hypothetical protein
MEWSKLYSSLPDSPRVQAAEDNGSAFGLLVESMCYCADAESGGFIPDTQVRRFLCHRPVRLAALVRERLWIREEGKRGYLLDPDIWNEAKNLSDSVEKKKQADRERIAAKRAAAKAAQNGDMSRDMSRDGRMEPDATSSRDSRTVDQIRSESLGSVVRDLSRRFAPAREDDDLLKVVIDSIHQRAARVIGADQAALIADEILAGQQVKNPRAYVQTAILREPNPAARWLPAVPEPDPCGKCNSSRRLEDPVTGDDAGPCPECHPSLRKEAS